MTEIEYTINKGNSKTVLYRGNIMGATINRLRELRKESKITQEQLAQYLEVDQSMITKLENGTRNLNTTLIEKLCSLYGCSEKYLLGEEDSYIPLNFAFRANGIQAEDFESIAAINKIVMNIRYMNSKLGEE